MLVTFNTGTEITYHGMRLLNRDTRATPTWNQGVLLSFVSFSDIYFALGKRTENEAILNLTHSQHFYWHLIQMVLIILLRGVLLSRVSLDLTSHLDAHKFKF